VFYNVIIQFTSSVITLINRNGNEQVLE